MPFLVVMTKTIRDLLTVRRTVALLALGSIPGWFFPLAVWQDKFGDGRMSLEMQTGFLVGYFILFSFLWMAGFFLAYLTIGSTGLGLISGESDRGTLLLMVSRPISRTQILLGKFLGLIATALLLEAIVLPGTILLWWYLLGIDPETVSALVRLMPWTLAFSVLLALVFSSVSVALSTLVRSGPVRAAVFTAILLAVFAGGPVLRLAWPDTYEDYKLYWVDGGYNTGNAYSLLLDRTETGRMTPQGQAWIGIFNGNFKGGSGLLLSAFVGATADFDPDIGAMPPSLERIGYIEPAVSTVMLLLIAGGAFWAANAALIRREVQ